MPAIADLPPKPPVVFPCPLADAFGHEGMFVAERAEEVARHWEDRAEWLLAQSGESDEFDYEILPLVVVGSVDVEYNFIGRLEPMPYALDD